MPQPAPRLKLYANSPERLDKGLAAQQGRQEAQPSGPTPLFPCRGFKVYNGNNRLIQRRDFVVRM